MVIENIITLIAGIIETGALGFFIFQVVKGLKTEITTLQNTISQQGKTIEVMEKRISETEKIGEIYKTLISDIPQDIENYKSFITKTKDSIIFELREENTSIKDKLKETKKLIETSRDSKEQIEEYLKVLKRLMSPYKQKFGGEEYLMLKDISEFDKFQIENSVKTIVESQTIQEFFNNLGITIEINDDITIVSQILKTVNAKKEKIPMRAQWSLDGHYLLLENKIILSSSFLSLLENEFSILKQ